MLQHYNSRALVGKLRQFLLLIMSRRKLETFNLSRIATVEIAAVNAATSVFRT
jgi:hypothetical protein